LPSAARRSCRRPSPCAPRARFVSGGPLPRSWPVLRRSGADRLTLSDARATASRGLRADGRKLAALPAQTLGLDRRGLLREGYYADVVVFDPETIRDRATFTEPHQYAEGMVHVFVNGGWVLRDGEHTGAKPGRFVKGPGAREAP
jgi:N-acyl-D-aspartate/D-glutamate deacylase